MSRVIMLGVTAGVVLVTVVPAAGQGHYELVWCRQWDRSEVAGIAGSYQVWVFDENGARMGNVEIRDHNGNHLLNADGNARTYFTSPPPEAKRAEIFLYGSNPDVGVSCYDNNGSTSDATPIVSVNPYGGHIVYEAGFVYKADANSIGTAATKNYDPNDTDDPVTGDCGTDDYCGKFSTTDVPQAHNPYSKSMVYSHQYWPSYSGATAWALLPTSTVLHQQSFVATGINRVLGFFGYAVQGAVLRPGGNPDNPADYDVPPDQWAAEIREGAGPDGPLVCRKTQPFPVFFGQPLAFPRDACPVVPGEVYTVVLDPYVLPDCNVYYYPGTNYADGQYYNNGTPDSSKDMYGFVWGWNAGVGTHGILKGQVTKSGTTLGVSGALVALTGGPVNDSRTTSPVGNYGFNSLLAGSYTLTVSKTNYTSHSEPVTVDADTIVVKNVELVSTIAWADFNEDHHVDVADFAVFQLCFGGAAQPIPGNCVDADADHDGDNDVDVADFASFQLCFAGPASPPAPGCPP